ncbi:hypothetical protein D3F29_22970 [Salmonella enterica subsp. enterica serovar Havana]|nr:hypothetical protein [Salmonella enterica]ECU4129786.1 hypothetical protein [Salmonella enterica subsp. enterica serovar Havana]
MSAYVQYMPAGWVCIGVTYADDWHMRMSSLCRCAAYGYAVHILLSHFSTADPKTPSYGSSSPPHNATSCKHNMWCRIQLLMTLYVVSSP